jgi:hypothetical protein
MEADPSIQARIYKYKQSLITNANRGAAKAHSNAYWQSIANKIRRESKGGRKTIKKKVSKKKVSKSKVPKSRK